MAMQQQPAVVVHGQAHVAIVRTSLAACTLIPFATDNFVNVRVLEGSDRGKEGWLCSEMISVILEGKVGPYALPARSSGPSLQRAK
jgi:hypothetical protein